MERVLRAAVTFLRSAAVAGGAWLRQPAFRCRLLIVAAGAFISLYSVVVLWRVMSAPDIGLSYSFSLNVLRVFDGFDPPGEDAGPGCGDTITKLADQEVD